LARLNTCRVVVIALVENQVFIPVVKRLRSLKTNQDKALKVKGPI
jgi:hypothetical protein